MGLLTRLRPIDWTRGAGRPAAVRPASVDIVIPVYGAPAELQACLTSVAEETDLGRNRVLLVLDGPQQRDVEDAVRTFASAHEGHVLVERNRERRGFAASVNRGMALSTTDVVLLNSDTVVTPRWLEKLVDAAYSAGDVGTVTPLSNNATLCSVPRAFEENLLPSGFDVRAFASLVERVSERRYVRIPTGVGFCLYIRRALLDDIGAFDAERFAGGYGEENDFCVRALARGWVHVADDATFIRHAGHRSFGASRERRQKHAAARLSRAHRRYMATIAELMRIDPLAPVRSAIEGALGEPPLPPASRPLRIVHVVHGWPPFQHAGTELYAYWLVRRQLERHHVAVYTRGADPTRVEGEAVELFDRGARVRLVTNNFTQRDPLRRNAIRDRASERDFERFLREEKPDLVHIHHLAGHAFSLAAVPKRLGIPLVMQIQDWWALCARVNLLHRDGVRCSGPSPSKCAACATLTRIPPGGISNRLVHALRRGAARRALRAADAFVAGSKAIRDDYAPVVPPSTPFHVIPYGIALRGERREPESVRRPIRIGYVGSIAPHKGVHLAVEAMRGIDPAQAVLHVWGDAQAFPDYVRSMPHGREVVFEGTFPEDEKARVFASMDVLLVPSIGLESFGLAAREAMATGVPIIASSGGALAEMFEPGVCGDFFPPGDAGALAAIIRRVVEDPDVLLEWARHLPATKDDAEHAWEIERVYQLVLKEREL